MITYARLGIVERGCGCRDKWRADLNWPLLVHGECAAQERRSYISRMAEAKSGVHEMYMHGLSSVRLPRVCATVCAVRRWCATLPRLE
jgi:hypothetical protein